jgi:acetyl esterase/lipase
MDCFRSCSIILVLACVPVASGLELTKTTYTFKKVGDVEIRADVYRPADGKMRPGLVWIHGGALVSGSRLSVPKQLMSLAEAEGYVLISIDYRLAPEVKLPEIIADLKDAFAWVRTAGPKLFQVDAGKLVVAGGSAGGYLTMMTGICVEPPPRALVAYWGYGDVDGDWYTKPSAFYRQRPLVSRDDAYRGVHKGVLTFSDAGNRDERSRFYLYLRQNGLWTREVTGFDPSERAKLDPYCPVRNTSKDYPPILMLHGTADTDVPYELSANMAKELARHGVRHELITVPDGDHGLSRGDPQRIAAAHARAAAFIREQLR